MRTPAVLVSTLVLNYMLQEFFQLLGMNMIASIFSLILMLAVISLATWAYARYSGNVREIGQRIDEAVEWSWKNFLGHIAKNAIAPATNMTLRLQEVGLLKFSGYTA